VLRFFFVTALLLAIPGSFAQVRPIEHSPKLAAVATPAPADANDDAADDSANDEDTTADEATTAAPNAPPTTAPPRPTPSRVAAAQPPPPAQRPTPVPGDDGVNLQFPNSDVDDVLRMYENLTGKKLVRDNFVQGKVNIFINKKVPRDEAIKIIEINLLMNGFSLVPAGGDIVKVIGTGRNARSAGVPLISDDSQIPEGEHVVSYLFRLRYADPTELQQVLQQYLSQPGGAYSAVQPLPKAGAVLVTENSAVIRTIAKIVEQVDIPPAEVVSEFIKLERADASKVVDMLKEIFEKGQQQPGQPPVPGVRVVRPAQPIPQPQQVSDSDIGALTALSEEAVVVGKIKMTPDVRTNRIHVVTRPINMPFIRKLIAEFDANVEFAKPITRPLKYISAGDVLPVLVTSLTEPGTNQQGGAGDLGANNPANQQQQQNRQNRTGTPTNPYTGGQSSTASDSSLNVSEELSTTAVDTSPKAVTIGNAKIIADQRSNAIIVLGNREVVVKVQKILDEMDVSAPQVALSTVIGELTLHNEEQIGVDYFLRLNRKTAATTNFTGVKPFAGGGSTTTTPVTGGTPITTTTGGNIFDPGNLVTFTQLAENAAGGANVYLAAGNTLAAVVHLLNMTNNFKVISRPTVFTSNNKKAIIASGTEIPVPVSTLSSVVNGSVTNTNIGQQSNIQFKKVALQLEVVPLINSEKEVSLDILQKLDSLAGSQTIDGNSIPTIATRYIRTNVTSPNGATIVLGGLITDSKRKDHSGVPYLDRVPLLGYLFRTTSKVNDRTELIILMCPQVSLTQLDLHRARMKTEDNMHFGPEVDQGNCPDCPGRAGEDKQLPAPDLPPEKVSLNNK
jgi:general secretion pathway protein D